MKTARLSRCHLGVQNKKDNSMKKALLILIVLSISLVGCSYDFGNISLNSQDTSDSVSDFSVESAVTSTEIDSEDQSTEVSEENKINFVTVHDGNRYGFADVVESIQSCVVAINVTGIATNYYYTYPTEGSGSGVIVSKDGYIVTNNHVVSGGNNITVFLNDNTKYTAKLIASDSVTDIAILKINAEDLNAAVIGDSSTLRVGDFALAIGNPLGEYQGSVTLGIVSALNREIVLNDETHTMFQVDAAISPGNSGGGMFDSNGALIGIVTAKTVSEDVEGLGFVLPINDVKPIIEDLINYGYVKGRPTLGFEAVEITSKRVALYYGLDRLGVYVSNVEKGSFAEQSGIQYKDYISSADGETIATVERLEEILNSKSIGDTLVLEIWRGNTVLDVVLVIDEKTN